MTSQINRAISLHGTIPGCSFSNLIELIMLFCDIKPVVRLMIKNKDLPALEQLISMENLHLAVSNYAIVVDYKTNLGDLFLKTIDSVDSNGLDALIVTISKEKESATRALQLEQMDDEVLLAKLYNYPYCCVKAYKSINQQNDWLFNLLENTQLKDRYSLYGNKISYLFNDKTLLFEYFPCSLECKETIEKSKLVHSLLIKSDNQNLAASAIKNMARPILVFHGMIISFKRFKLEKDKLIVDFTEAEFYNWHASKTLLKSPVWISDRISQKNGYLFFYQGDKLIKKQKADRQNVRLLVFT